MRPQQALAGKKVYGQGSHAPTKGRVSANGMQGYLQRSQRQQVQKVGGVRRIGGDGKSDTRSGLAAKAMQRRNGDKQIQRGGSGGGRPIRQGAGKQSQPNHGGRPNVGVDKAAYQNGGRPVVGGGAASATGAQSNGSMQPQVTVNNNGQLELPYNSAWSQELLQGLGQSNADLAALQGEQQAEGIAYNQANRQAGEDYTGQKRTTLSNNAGAGTMFSSAYGVQSSNDANNYQNTINTLLSEHSAQGQAFDTERTAIINAFKQQMQSSAIPYAETVAEEAGTLGYGRGKAKKPPNKTNMHRNDNKGKNRKRKHPGRKAAQVRLKNRGKK